MYTNVPVEEFRGLDLTSDPANVGLLGAVDAQNVVLSRSKDRVSQRPGSSAFFTDDSGTGLRITTEMLAVVRDEAELLIFGGDGIYALDDTGTELASAAHTPVTAVSWRSPTASYGYYSRSGASIGKWDGTNFSTPAGMPTATYIGVTPVDNRLVAARIDSTNLNRVQFSDAGDPETWGADNYVDLPVERVQDVVSWGEYTFVFSPKHAFVFYGTTTDSTGAPVFNYRTVSLGTSYAINGRAACAGTEGVYFVARDGVYVTAGGPPRKISGPLDAWFAKETFPTYGGPTFGFDDELTEARIAYINRRVYVSIYVPATSASRVVFVYDVDGDVWTRWAMDHITGFIGWRTTGGREKVFFGERHIDDTRVTVLDSTVATDRGTAIDSYYRSGVSDLGSVQEKTIRETLIHGTGSVGYSMSTDYAAADTAATVTLGSSPAIAHAFDRVARRGRRVGFRFDDVSGAAWTVHGLSLDVRETRLPGTDT